MSSLISLVIILFSIIFSVISIYEYLEYKSPIIVYTKANDHETKREAFMKDTLLMFQVVDTKEMLNIDKSIAYYEAQYTKIYDNGTLDTIPLKIETCELGKNLDMKYKKIVDFRDNLGRRVEDFYCLNLENQNISLFYHPNVGYSSITLKLYLKKNNKFIPEKLQTLIVGQNDLIDHTNKNTPINNSYIYDLTQGFHSREYTQIKYYFEYIKYESDGGFFFKNPKILNGIYFSDMSFFKNIKDDYDLENNLTNSNKSLIGEIEIEIHKSHFDNYNRSYQRFQSLLAEIMSVVNLLLEIGRQISTFLCDKKMSKDIIKSLLNNDNKYEIEQQKNRINNFFQNSFKKEINTERKKMKQELECRENNINNLDKIDSTKINRNLNDEKEEQIKNTRNKIIDDINIFHIIKSYFCCKDKTSELVNLCNNIIMEDLCIERILQRLYNLEQIYNFFSNIEKEKLESIKNKRFNDINNYIYKIKDDKNIVIYNRSNIDKNTTNIKDNPSEIKINLNS